MSILNPDIVLLLRGLNMKFIKSSLEVFYIILFLFLVYNHIENTLVTVALAGMLIIHHLSVHLTKLNVKKYN